MKDEIDWEKAEAMADAMTDDDIGLKPGQRMYTPKEGRLAYLRSLDRAKRSPSFASALCRVQKEQRAARALRLMRESAKMTQREVARRMDVKPTAVSRLERFGASTIRALSDYARACGYKIRIVAESPTGSFAL